MTDEMIHIGQLTPDPANARKHNPRNVGLIERALGEVGAARSIVIDENGVVLAGNATIEAAAAAGIEKMRVVDADGETIIAVRRTGLTPDQKKRLALFDNRTSELADWDVEQLLADRDAGLDLAAVGFDADELAALLAGIGDDPAEGLTDPDAVPPVPAVPVTKPGDIVVMGRHRLICGDSSDPAVIARLMGDERAALVATDPPYNVGFAYDGAYAGQDSKSPEEYGAWLRSILDVTEEYLTDGAPVFVWQGMLNVQYFGSWFGDKEWRIFAACKNFIQARPTWLQYAWDPVVCWVHGTTGKRNHAGVRDWHVAITSNTQPTPDRKISGEHPCPRPVDTVVFILEAHTEKGDIALEPFAGSGTTIIAAEQTGRSCYAAELDPAYCDVICRRWEQFTGLRAVRQ